MSDFRVNNKMCASSDTVDLKYRYVIKKNVGESEVTDCSVNEDSHELVTDEYQKSMPDSAETSPSKNDFDNSPGFDAVNIVKAEADVETNLDYRPEKVFSLFPFVCGICDLKVNSISTYLAHFQVHEHVSKYLHCCLEKDKASENTSEALYSCGTCGDKFPSLCTLYRHLVANEKAQDFVFLGNKRTAYLSDNWLKVQEDCDNNKTVGDTDKVCVDKVTDNEVNLLVDTDKCKEITVETEVPFVPKINLKRKRKSNRKNAKTLEKDRCENTTSKRSVKKILKKINNTHGHGKHDIDKMVDNSKKVCFDKITDREAECKKNKEMTAETDVQAVPKRTFKRERKSNKKVLKRQGRESCKDTDTVSNSTVMEEAESTNREENMEASLSKIYTESQPNKVTNKGRLMGSAFPCETCGKMIKYESLRGHRATHLKHTIPCDLCDMMFQSKFGMQAHKATVHATDKKFTCDECGKSFKALSYLRQHSQTHLKERNIQCPICHEMFLYKNVLRIHLLTHSEERPYHCDICGKGFKRQHAILIHKEGVHEAVEKYPCTDCNKKFVTKDRLRKHRHIHQPPNFSCQVCGKTFIRNDNLRTHLKVHGETT